MFPTIVVFPPNHPFLIGFSIINHPFWGTPNFWKHPYIAQIENLQLYLGAFLDACFRCFVLLGKKLALVPRDVWGLSYRKLFFLIGHWTSWGLVQVKNKRKLLLKLCQTIRHRHHAHSKNITKISSCIFFWRNKTYHQQMGLDLHHCFYKMFEKHADARIMFLRWICILWINAFLHSAAR